VTGGGGPGGGGAGNIHAGVIAHWTLSGDLLDSVGNVNLTHGGGGTPTFGAGKIGNALVLNGTKFATTGTHSINGTRLFPVADNPFSVAVWWNTSQSGTLIASASSVNTDRDFQIAVSFSGMLDIYMRGVQTNQGPGFNDGQWHHVVVTWNGTTGRSYIDGQLTNNNLGIGSGPEETNEHIIIGARTGGSGFLLTGSLDDVWIYNRAISLPEVTTLYTLTTDNSPPTVPSNFEVAATASSVLTASWSPSTDNGPPPITYRVQACQGAGCSNFFDADSTEDLILPITGLTMDTVYRLRVRACDGAALCSAYAGPVSATTLSEGGMMRLQIGTITGGTIR
jgi:hypothetical protein